MTDASAPTIDPKTDPFLRKWYERGMPWDGAAWHFEAARRYLSYLLPQFYPYHEGEETWAWSNDMLEELAAVEGVGLSRCHPDPDGPGFGVHVFARRWAIGAYGHLEGEHYVLNTPVVNETPIQIVRATKEGITCGGFDLLGQLSDNGLPPWTNFHDSPVLRRWFVVVQALLKSQAVVVKSVLPERTVRRQARRDLGLDMDVLCRVVNWRRPPRDTRNRGKEGEMAHDKHWWVSGHVRAQWYPSQNTHHGIYIEPHVKGNIDAPLHRPVRVNYVRA